MWEIKQKIAKIEWILLIAFLNALVYVFLVPPWQHNDEPGNFEFVWLLANLENHPKSSDYVDSMRREVTSSLREHSFFEGLDIDPVLLVTYEPTWIGISQVGNQPLYFFVLSIPLKLLRSFDVTFQMYVGRLISVLFFMLTIILSYKTTRLLIGNSLLAYWTVIFIALMPGFVDKMTAVNDDVAAVMAVSFSIWISIKLLKQGISWVNFLGLLLAIGICLLTKRTSWIGVFVTVLALYFHLVKTSIIRSAILLIAIFGLVIISSLSFSVTSPAYYYSSNNFSIPQRVRLSSLEHFSYVAQQKPKTLVYQTIDQKNVPNLAGKKFTFGGYFWADEDIEFKMPDFIINDKVRIEGERIWLSKTPQIFYYSNKFPENAQKIVLSISTWGMGETNHLFWDCLFLIEDVSKEKLDYLKNSCLDSHGKIINNNYLKNGSNEQGWPVLNPSVSTWLDEIFQFSITNFWSIFDLGATWGYYYYGTIIHLFRTFWGGFGWGGVGLVGRSPYILFFAVTFFALVGNFIFFVKKTQKIDWKFIFVLGIPAIILLWMSLFRGAGNWYLYGFTPTARYFYPVIIPLSIFINNGIINLINPFVKKSLQKHSSVFIVIIFFAYNVWAWYSIWHFFYR